MGVIVGVGGAGGRRGGGRKVYICSSCSQNQIPRLR